MYGYMGRYREMSPWSATLPSASQLATIQWGSTSAGAKSGLVPTAQPSSRSTESFLVASSSPRTWLRDGWLLVDLRS